MLTPSQGSNWTVILSFFLWIAEYGWQRRLSITIYISMKSQCVVLIGLPRIQSGFLWRWLLEAMLSVIRLWRANILHYTTTTNFINLKPVTGQLHVKQPNYGLFKVWGYMSEAQGISNSSLREETDIVQGNTELEMKDFGIGSVKWSHYSGTHRSKRKPIHEMQRADRYIRLYFADSIRHRNLSGL